MTALEVVLPEGWPRTSGYSDAIVVPAGRRLVFVAGQVGWDERHELAGYDFVPQFRRAVENVVAVVRAAGGGPADVASMTVFVRDRRQYLERLKECGAAWREVMGRHYPAMALVEAALIIPGALVEIQAVAAVA